MGILYKKKHKLQKGKIIPYAQDATRVETTKRIIPEGNKPEKPLTEDFALESNLIEPNVLSISNNPNLIDKLNIINPGRFSRDKVDIYDRYDKDIHTASRELEKEGEAVDTDLIKTIMMIETGMEPFDSKGNPRTSKTKHAGFPQTKPYIVEWINKKFGTDFEMKDMYKPKEAAKFIHYMIKDLGGYSYINSPEDIVSAYNWGPGNFKKYKYESKEMPKETSNYIKFTNILMNR